MLGVPTYIYNYILHTIPIYIIYNIVDLVRSQGQAGRTDLHIKLHIAYYTTYIIYIYIYYIMYNYIVDLIGSQGQAGRTDLHK